jgi:hypothetical protein
MLIRQPLFSFLIALTLFSPALAQQPNGTTQADPPASPEMKRLSDALAGDWNTVETMERSQFFPNGAGRHGITHVRLGAGGTTLISEGRSDGSAGKLRYLIAIWWDKDAGVYHFFTCFNGDTNPCVLRGTAHWEGDTFVNEYEETVNGKKTKFRDVFSHITPTSRTLVALSIGTVVSTLGRDYNLDTR